MDGTELVIKIDILYFLGIISSLFIIAWYAGHRIGGLETSVEWIKRELQNMWESIKSKEALEGGFSESHSPVKLSEKGQALLSESKTKDIIDRHTNNLIKEIEKLNPQTAYDAQSEAFVVFGNLVADSEPLLSFIKNFIFQKPIFKDTKIDISDIVYVGSIYLRDLYLDKHPELKGTRDVPLK